MSPPSQTLLVQEYRDQITLLHPFLRHLFLYLLELLAVFHFESDVYKMTSARLATIFQPVILSPVETGDEFIAEEKSRRLSIDVLNLLLQNQDNFMIVMSGQDDWTWHWRPYLCHHLQ